MGQKKIRCKKCDKVICTGIVPASVTIKCDCGYYNDLSSQGELRIVIDTDHPDRDGIAEVLGRHGFGKKIV